ncbi:MAG: tetratricopeptide repeat protein [Phycisphaerales bacterium JB043]
MLRNTTRFFASFLASSTLALGACSGGHGKHTTEALTNAQERMSSIKAATSWDLARQQFQVGDLEKALKNVDESIGYNPNVAKAHSLRGRILLELGQIENSIQSFNEALAHDPQYDEAFYYKGISLERINQIEGALTAYTKAADLTPQNAQYAIAAAEMHIELDQLDEAEQILNERKELLEHNSGVRQTLGHIALLNHDAEGAVALFRESRLLAPDDITVAEDLAHALVYASDWVEGEYTLRTLLNHEDYAERRDLKRLHARTLVALDRPVEARTLLLSLTTDEKGKNDSASWIDLGNVALHLGDLSRARVAARQVIALKPDRPEGYALLAAAQIKGGDQDAALESLAQAMEFSTDDASPGLLRGLLLAQMGEHEEAQEMFNWALEINPTDERLLDVIATSTEDDEPFDQ